MSHPRTILTALLLALALPAPPAGGQQVVDLPAGDRELSPATQEVYRVGSLGGADWETFSRLNQVAFDGQANLYILDGENHRVVVVAPSGELRREMGREGGGPGEFRNPTTLAVAEDGTTAVFDLGHRAFVVFDPEGSYSHMVSVDPEEGLPGIQTLFLPDGDIVSASGQGIRMITTGRSLEAESAGVPIQRYSLEEQGGVRTIARAWDPPMSVPDVGGPEFQSSGGRRIRMGAMPQPKAFSPVFRMTVLPDGRIAYTDTVTYSVKILSSGGRLETVLRRPFDPRPVTRADQAREKERRRRELEEGEGPQMSIRVRGEGGGTRDVGQDAIREMLEGRIEAMEFADRFPVVGGLASDWEGRLWVRRTNPEPEGGGPMDVLLPQGEYLGTVPDDWGRLPDAFGPGGLAAYIEVDELDVPSVVVKRVSLEGDS